MSHVDQLLDSLAQLGGGRSDLTDAVLRLLLPAVFCMVLGLVAVRQWQGARGRADLYATIASLLGRLRQAEAQPAPLLRERSASLAVEGKASQWRDLLTNLAEGVIVTGHADQVLLMNQSAREMLRFTEPESGKSWSLEDYQHLDMRRMNGLPLPFEAWPICRARVGESFANHELLLVHPDGSRSRLLFSGSAVRDKSRKVVLAITLFRHAADPSKTDQQAAQEYISLISHDLRTPLTVMMGQAEWMRRLLSENGQEREAASAASILRNARWMSTMLQDLVESARLEASRQERRKTLTDLLQLISDTAEQLDTPADRERIQVRAPIWVPPVMADPDRIRRVVANLLTNALKYSPPGSPMVMELGRTETEALVSVADQGVGIPADDLPHVFDKYYRGQADKKIEGLGLGLYISRLIVEAHGGRIMVASEPGKGSTFTVSLPLA
ncbi:MAG: PAS domain-containing sensor histidine kinase [Chloroflexota bacterium]|nr:MAG: PAS domain-containing sensor histidine kinase [Chloroflexota bacterium]